MLITFPQFYLGTWLCLLLHNSIRSSITTAGNPVRDDVTIILGVSEVNLNSNDQSSEIKTAIIDLLRMELDLEVLQVGPKLTRGIEAEASTRRPAFLQRLKVTRKSLHQWLQRRLTTTNSNMIDSDSA